MSRDVMVAWVHSEQVSHSWAISLLNLMMTDPRVSPRWSAVACGTDGLVAARNATVASFLTSPDQWLFWVDTDMGYAPETASRLAEVADPQSAPVVGALCFASRRVSVDGMNGERRAAMPTLFRWVELPDGRNGFQPMWHYERDAVVQVAGTGSACILIHRSVFERITAQFGPDRWYQRLTNPTTGEVLGEDLSFCYRASQVGVPMFVHTGVRTTHLKPVWLQEDDYVPPEEVA